jgi:CRP-like cAMP-binding protein
MITTKGINILDGLTRAIHPLNNSEWDDFLKVWSPVTCSRKELLTVVGDTEKYLYVVLEGVQRVYYTDETDREATLVFSYPPSFGGVLDSFLLQQPSRYFYETLSPSVFLRASATDIQRLMQEHRSVEALIRKGVTMATSGILERLVELQCFSAEDRFRSLLNRSPHILQWVPHKYLANYLGMDATNFSKLMNKVKI